MPKLSDKATITSFTGVGKVAVINDSAGTPVVRLMEPVYVEAGALTVPVRNISGATLTKGDVVYASGYNVGADLVEVSLADASSGTTMPALGIVKADIANNASGSVLVRGRLEGINTSSFSVGDVLYVSETAGQMTATKPTGSALVQVIAEVLRSNVSTGVVDIEPQTGPDLTGFIATLLDDTTAAAARTTLGADITTASSPSDLTPDSATTQTGTTYTLAAADHETTILFSNASQVTVTIPTNASVSIAVGSKFTLQSTGAGGLTLSTTGITLNGSAPNKTIAQNEALYLEKTATDTWSVLGGTAA